jgi:hypothetical protein
MHHENQEWDRGLEVVAGLVKETDQATLEKRGSKAAPAVEFKL